MPLFRTRAVLPRYHYRKPGIGILSRNMLDARMLGRHAGLDLIFKIHEGG